MFYQFLTNPANLPVIAILAGSVLGVVTVIMGILAQIVKILVKHRERMAKIAHGIDPEDRPRPGTSPGRQTSS